ncbi:regulatory protein RecX [Helcococcus kunzii]|uniref:Regulatory protein RecX n=1 Tax=Helcococcus kunzii ATCC 51366 TaxID=883114 RepID=H3NND0_9FIRM|nr:regulatory protein RecX [Helcococcus kunzii]EHR33905.1 hypothetical protein HMPREF9709_00841 [Helcococcus kunzii ATCC 51366]
MQITKISYDEQRSLFNIQLDTDEKFNISYEIYEKFALKTDQILDVELYNILEKENDYQNAKKVAENYLNYKSRTTHELINKLKSVTKNEKSINKVIEYYKRLDILNDKRYAEEFIKVYLTMKNESMTKTKYKLMQKGISAKMIDSILEGYDREIEYENIKIIFEKKYKNKDLSDFKEKQKAFRYLSSRGFQYDAIKRILG